MGVKRRWREHVFPLSLLWPLTLELMVIWNVYNGDLGTFHGNHRAEVEYALMMVPPMLALAVSSAVFGRNLDFVDVAGVVVGFVSLLQWVIHSPFDAWLIGTPTSNDVRHRTEYYDTHVAVFGVCLFLLSRHIPPAASAASARAKRVHEQPAR